MAVDGWLSVHIGCCDRVLQHGVALQLASLVLQELDSNIANCNLNLNPDPAGVGVQYSGQDVTGGAEKSADGHPG